MIGQIPEQLSLRYCHRNQEETLYYRLHSIPDSTWQARFEYRQRSEFRETNASLANDFAGVKWLLYKALISDQRVVIKSPVDACVGNESVKYESKSLGPEASRADEVPLCCNVASLLLGRNTTSSWVWGTIAGSCLVNSLNALVLLLCRWDWSSRRRWSAHESFAGNARPGGNKLRPSNAFRCLNRL